VSFLRHSSPRWRQRSRTEGLSDARHNQPGFIPAVIAALLGPERSEVHIVAGLTLSPFKAVEFPSQRPLRYRTPAVGHQGQMFNESSQRSPDSSDEPYTKVESVPASTLGFEVFHGLHRARQNVHGYWHGSFVSSIIDEEEFDVYFRSGDGLLIVRARRDVAESVAARLSATKRSGFELRKYNVNFDLLRQAAANVTGAWFSNMQLPNIRTEGAYGSQIDLDPEFRRLSQVGVITSLRVRWQGSSTLRDLYVGEHGSVYFEKQILLDDAISVVDSLGPYRYLA
jgi:hypothetical protein